MSGAAEYLQGQSRIHSASSFFQKTNVLIFSLANASQSCPETYPDPVLWLFARIGQAGVVQRHLRRRDRELRVTIHSATGASAGIRNRKSCTISTRTPSGVSRNVQTTFIPRVKALRW